MQIEKSTYYFHDDRGCFHHDFEDYYSGSPIPRSGGHLPYEYEIRENEAGGYAFKLWIITESQENYKIKEIQDNYCWKFLSIKTKEWFQNEMADILPQEYKMICRTSSWDRFGNNINENSSIKDYFETSKEDIDLILYIIAPQNKAGQDDEFVREEVENAVNKFYKQYENMAFSLWYLQTKSEEDYKSINEREMENSAYLLRGKIKSIWDITDIEEKFKIEISSTD